MEKRRVQRNWKEKRRVQIQRRKGKSRLNGKKEKIGYRRKEKMDGEKKIGWRREDRMEMK